MKIKDLIKILIVNSFVFTFLVLIGELIARSFYPEFKGDIYSENISRSVKVQKGSLDQVELSRIPYDGWEFDNSKGMFLIIGDSVTYGFGTPYEEIYWVKLKSLHNLLLKNKLEFLPFAQYGNNLSQKDLLPNIKKLSNNFKSDDKFILYQFNYNDVTPQYIKESKAISYIKRDQEINKIYNENLLYKFKFNVKKITWTQLNKSVLLRIIQHYGATFKRLPLDYKSCEKKGLNALGAYTWTFGSKGFEKESQIAWNLFENDLKELKKISDLINAKLFIFLTPTIFDIDKKSAHRYFNSYRLDFSCATINPDSKLNQIAGKLNIQIINPKQYIREKFESTLKEGNFIPFYFPADTNHLTPAGQTHLSNFLFKEIFANR